MEYLKDLSGVFPKNTGYFYGYPRGWCAESKFLNNATTSAEELVAARPLICAGGNIDIVVFARTVADNVLNLLQDELGTEITQRRIVLPSTIDIHLINDDRNKQIMKALQNSTRDGALVMAQPYISPEMEKKYLINPQISAWANDKDNIRNFVPEQYRIPELARAQSGANFKSMDADKFTYPCVIKLSASSGGDGVRICKSAADFKAAQETFASYDCPILVLKFIETVKEVGAKFAIYKEPIPRFARIGTTKDFSSHKGDWVGSLVGKNIEPTVTEEIYKVLEESVLPKLHAQGWYGVGEGGVLIDKDGRFYFSDFNCRITGDMPQTFQMNQGLFPDRQLMVFNGIRSGNLQDLEKAIKTSSRRGDKNQILNLVAAAEYDKDVKIHGGVLFDQTETLAENIIKLEKLGIQSALFERLREEKNL